MTPLRRCEAALTASVGTRLRSSALPPPAGGWLGVRHAPEFVDARLGEALQETACGANDGPRHAMSPVMWRWMVGEPDD
jgi:hypothetical protein